MHQDAFFPSSSIPLKTDHRQGFEGI